MSELRARGATIESERIDSVRRGNMDGQTIANAKGWIRARQKLGKRETAGDDGRVAVVQI